MDRFRDYLKSFLGVPTEPLRPNDLPRNIHEDFRQEFGHSYDCPHHSPHNWSPEVEWHVFQEEDDEDHDHMMFNGGSDMFRQMEEMFGSLFRGLQIPPDIFHGPRDIEQSPPIDDVPSWPGHHDQPPVENSDEPGSLRDKMLKQPDSKRPPQEHFGIHDQDQPNTFPEPHSWFGGFWRSPHDHPQHYFQGKEDKDLDSEVESGKHTLDDILSKKSDHSSLVPITPRSSSQTYSSITTIDSHGNTERRTTRRDSSGREEVTITRKLGDQEHKIKHWKNEDGSEETEENIINIDQDKLPEFNEKWKESKEESHFTLQDRTPMSSIFESILDQFFPRR